MWFNIGFAGVQFLSFLDIQIKSYGGMKIQDQLWAKWVGAGANEPIRMS
jgi:hypothetical protein